MDEDQETRVTVKPKSRESEQRSTSTMPPPRVAAVAAESRATTSAANGRRRSGVVGEVEKMQVAREKRRVQAATVTEVREEVKKNPNWKFLQMIEEYKEDLEIRPLRDGDPVSSHRITVCIRKRPLSAKEEKLKEVDVVTVATKDQLPLTFLP